MSGSTWLMVLLQPPAQKLHRSEYFKFRSKGCAHPSVVCWFAFRIAYPGMEVPSKMIIHGLVKIFQDKGCVQYRKYSIWQWWQNRRDPPHSWRHTRMIPVQMRLFVCQHCLMLDIYPVTEISCALIRFYQAKYRYLIRYLVIYRLLRFSRTERKVSMLSIAMEWPQVLLVNSLGSHLHSFSALGMRTDLAT